MAEEQLYSINKWIKFISNQEAFYELLTVKKGYYLPALKLKSNYKKLFDECRSEKCIYH